MIEDILKEAESKMSKAVDVAKEEFSGIRTGRANPALVSRLQVDYYGTPTPLQQLAGISAPEARLLVVSPYDRNATASIEKAIRNSDLGINPANDGQVIRLAFPQLTQERRKEYVKLAKHGAVERDARRGDLPGRVAPGRAAPPGHHRQVHRRGRHPAPAQGAGAARGLS